MDELIKVETKGNEQVVSARELHKGLEIKTRFNEWVSQNFKEFENGQDFMSAVTTADMPNGGVKQINDYILTIDMAKQLCLMSRTEKGRKYRKYLIEVEKAYKEQQASPFKTWPISCAIVKGSSVGLPYLLFMMIVLLFGMAQEGISSLSWSVIM
ncbi:hypothetical protein SY212_18140 [Ligilactobacillus agilis]|uniref:AntA/AntB antirepressor domain-containing protein n=1 Tax=Ligilactobacillus agilis TaxID=1601 RepID=A0A6F9XND0_9LACO|nr:antA/AntB antirepressor family protein [Ligilactobacillus agilis]GET06784.1 hypothetical protein SY212_18140 [Ligilactobacillus agilis]